jgi:hypothetical protein
MIEDVRFVGALVQRDESVQDVRACLVVVVASGVVLSIASSSEAKLSIAPLNPEEGERTKKGGESIFTSK